MENLGLNFPGKALLQFDSLVTYFFSFLFFLLFLPDIFSWSMEAGRAAGSPQPTHSKYCSVTLQLGL